MIRMFDYRSSMEPIREEIVKAVNRVLNSGRLILGPETEAFESEFAEYTGATSCIGVSSGTMALFIALTAAGIGPGDEVITVSNTCVPTVSAIEMTGAETVFVDVNSDDLLMDPDLAEKAIDDRTRAILPVHLWGQSADLDRLRRIADQNGLKLIEDCAQATGTTYKGRHAGNSGVAGCFSFYPTKNLGAYGDAGAVITNDRGLADRIRKIRTYGYDEKGLTVMKGTNGRISEVQAAILRVKLKYLPEWLEKRRENAAFYLKNISNPELVLPFINEYGFHAFHQFVLRTEQRDALAETLTANGIEYGIHYPVPVHRMPFYSNRPGSGLELEVTDKAAGKILSIPVHESLKMEEMKIIGSVLNSF